MSVCVHRKSTNEGEITTKQQQLLRNEHFRFVCVSFSRKTSDLR